MDINENKEQLEELEPLSADPQTGPEAVLEDSTAEDEQLESLADAETADDKEIDQDETPEMDIAVSAEEESDREAESLNAAQEYDLEAADDVDDMDSEPVTVSKPDRPYPFQDRFAPIDPVKDDGRVWYVIHCYSGNEDKVRHNIMQRIESMGMDNLIFDVVVPTEDEVNIKNGERQTVEKKVFPGYILVNMILTEESWYMVRNTPGVTGFVGMGNDPTPLQPEEVARILKRMESESPRINVTFKPGERVRIVDGPFEDFYGKVSEIDMDRATVRVMVNFFGRETPVELDFLQVEEA